MMQHKRMRLMSGLFLVLLVACTPATAAPVQDERLGSLESKVEMISQIQLDLTSLRYKVNELSGDREAAEALQTRLDDLQKRIDTLAAQIEAVPATGAANEAAADNPFDVAMVQYVLDSAGLHEIAVELEATKKITPAYLEKVNRAKKVMTTAKVPAELAEQNQSFLTVMNELAAALEANDAEKATELAKKAHGAQHGYTKAIDGWLSNAVGSKQ